MNVRILTIQVCLGPSTNEEQLGSMERAIREAIVCRQKLTLW